MLPQLGMVLRQTNLSAHHFMILTAVRTEVCFPLQGEDILLEAMHILKKGLCWNSEQWKPILALMSKSLLGMAPLNRYTFLSLKAKVQCLNLSMFEAAAEHMDARFTRPQWPPFPQNLCCHHGLVTKKYWPIMVMQKLTVCWTTLNRCWVPYISDCLYN